MDFTIKLKPDGTDETNAAADAIARVRDELEKTQKSKTKIDTRPRAVREAKEDRELDRYGDKIQKQLIRENKAREKAEAKTVADAQKSAARRAELDAKESARKQSTLEKSQAREEATRKKSEERKAKDLQRASEKTNKDLDKFAKDEVKASERKAKELARATEKANKDLEKYAKDEVKASEKKAKDLDRAFEKANKDLDKYAKDEANAAKKKVKDDDQSRAEKIDPGSKELTKTQKAVKAKFTDPLKLGIAGAAIAAGASLTGLVYKFAPLAMGYMGMARLSMISAQASFNMRRLFVGTNPKPLLDALQRTSQLIDPRTFTGKTLGEFFVRSADGIFNFISKAEPYVRLFFKGMLYGALQAEIAWLKLRIAIQPALNMLPNGIGLMTAFSAGALAIKASFGLMGIGIALGAVKAGSALLSFGRAALVATGPLLPFVAAVVALAAAYDQAIKLKAQWDENSSTQIGNKIKADLGITSKEESDAAMSKRQGITTGDDYDKKYKLGKYAEKPATPIPKGADKQAAAAGPPIGRNLGLGIVAGMKDVEGKVAAGGRDLVLAAEGGAKSEAEIKSPAAKWRREIGRNLGEGAALGLDDSADRMDSAARAMMPGAPGIGGIGGRAGGGGVVINQVFNGVDLTSARMIAREVRDALDNFAEQYGALA